MDQIVNIEKRRKYKNNNASSLRSMYSRTEYSVSCISSKWIRKEIPDEVGRTFPFAIQ